MGWMTAAAAMLASLTGAAGWTDGWAALERGVEAQETGEHHVWVWGEEQNAFTVTLDGHVLDIPAIESEAGHAWAYAGAVQLDAGQADFDTDGAVCAIVLAGAEEATPEAFLPDRRVYDSPRAADDQRAAVERDTDTVFTMGHFADAASWEAFADTLRRRILVASGLWPLPDRTPLNAQVFDPIDHGDYIVEKVHFEARPGYLVTGNLYRPPGDGPFPAIVSPHGHWSEGRLNHDDTGSIPARAITLARMGAVVFNYDMVGYVDSRQLEHHWGGPEEELWGVHPFALQLWSGIRAIDFLERLPYTDNERIGATGASGGGTQTFILTAVDDRIRVSAPVTMISSVMQGGCQCENAPLIRLENSNIEIGALAAPRPLMLVSATGDWTRETPRVEYPSIREIYALYGAEDRVANAHFNAGHNYNQDSREAVYRFFAKWLLDAEDAYAGFTEPEVTPDAPEDVRVFPDDEALPGALLTGDALLDAFVEQARDAARRHLPGDPVDLANYRRVFGPALADTLHAAPVDPSELAPERVSSHEREDHILEAWVIRHPARGAALPALFYRSKDAGPQEAVVLVHGDGKGAFASGASGGPGPLVRALLDRGRAVLLVDLFLQGEHHHPARATARHEGRYPSTFLPTDTAHRVRDIMTAAAFLTLRRDIEGPIALGGFGAAGVEALLAAPFTADTDRVFVDLAGFEGSEAAWTEKHFAPAIRAAGDLATAAALFAPKPAWLGGARDAFDTGDLARMYELSDAPGGLEVTADMPPEADIAAFLADE